MKRKKLQSIFYMMVLTVSLVAGCGKDVEKTEDSAKIVQVTNVDGNTITAQIGTITESEDKMAEGKKPEGTPPGKPEGTPPAMPEGGDSNMSKDAPPDGNFGGGFFEAGEETITFQITDSTKVILEQLQGKTDGQLEDIVKGAVLEVVLDKENNASEVTVRNLHAGKGFGGSDTVSNGTAVTTLDTDMKESGKTYESDGNDENALRVDGSTVTLENSTIKKTGGESSNTENGDFYGANAGLLAINGATVTISGAEVTTNAVNGNGIFSYGEGTTINVSDSKIRTRENNSGGIQTTGGGTMNAKNLDVETEGNSAAAIRSDRGGGTVNVDGGIYVTNGTGSPSIYSTANITVKNSTLKANASEGIVVEGKNSVTLENCDVVSDMDNTYHGDSAENIHGIMIYQSMSGDADVGEAEFSAKSGSITTKAGDLFYITNTDCKISLESVNLTLANDVLLRVEGNSSSRGWGTEGANGGNVILTAKNQTLTGNIIVDKISLLDMTLSGNSEFQGAVNSEGDGGTVKVTMKDQAEWSLTADSYVSEFNGDTAQVKTNGYHLYVNGKQVL